MDQAGVERRLAAILSADVVGYSRLMAEDEAGTIRTVTAYREEVELHVGQHRGRLVDFTGDNFLAEFPSALEAVRCAVEIQRVLGARNAGLPEPRRMEFRLGVHMGDIAAEGDRIYGDGVNIAARLQGLADPGGICISSAVHAQVQRRLEAEYEDLGEQALKNIPEPIRAFRVGVRKDLSRGRPLGSRAWFQVALGATSVVAAGATLWWFLGSALSDEPAALAGEKPSIAVLPFDNLSANPEEDEYFSDGVHDEIIAQLSKIAGLKVISRTSVMRYKDRGDRSLREIGADLGVATILEGTVRQAERRLRITAQLLDARTDEHLWTETYNRDLTDIFAIQSDVALRIVKALEAKLSPSERERIQRRPTESLEAYDLYLKGQYFTNQWTVEGIRQGIEYFSEAAEKYPEFVLAHVGLSRAYSLLACCSSGSEDLPPAAYYRTARQAGERALAIDNTLGGVHSIIGWAEWALDLDWQAAERRFRQAIEFDPGDAWAHTRYGIMLIAVGRYDEALERTKLATELDPLAPVISQDLAVAFLYAGRYQEAEEQAKRAVELAPDFPVVHGTLAEVYLGQGRYEEAIAALRRAEELSPGGSGYLSRLAYAYAVSGDRSRAEELARVLRSQSEAGYVSPVSMAIVHAGLGEADEAIDWLEKAFETGDGWLALARAPLEFEELQSHPRFIALREKIGLGN